MSDQLSGQREEVSMDVECPCGGSVSVWIKGDSSTYSAHRPIEEFQERHRGCLEAWVLKQKGSAYASVHGGGTTITGELVRNGVPLAPDLAKPSETGDREEIPAASELLPF